MIRKLLAAMVLTSGALATAVPAAQAGQSDYADCVIVVDPTTFESGDEVSVSGSGLQPNFEATIEFHSVVIVVGTVTTDDNGEFSTTIIIPEAEPGPHTISVVCDAAGNVSETDVTISSVSVPTDGDDGELPFTGSDVEPLVLIGGAALLVGVVLVLVTRRRRQSTSV
jgi:alpha-L-fucosidase